MSLVRCPGCKIDTSDSLAHCPNCGAVLQGSGPRLFDQRPTAAPEPLRREHSSPRPAASSPFEAAVPEPSSPRLQTTGISSQVKAIAFVVLLFVLALVPHSVPLFVMAVVFWLLAKRQSAGKPNRQMEALKIVVNEVSRGRNKSSKERPLDMLRRIEQQLKTPPRA